MKLISEFPLRGSDDKSSLFTWVPNNSTWLFIIEHGKRMRTLNIDNESSSEVQSATLADNKTCTSLSWNRDGTVLALVVDKRQVYFWEVKINSFLHFKTNIKPSGGHNLAGKREASRDIDMIVWSKVSNTLAMCYSSGQIHLCSYGEDVQEKLIDNSMGVLAQISSIESSDYLDIFVCVTVIYEVLVMSFSGSTRVYIQSDSHAVCLTKFSVPSEPDADRKLSRVSDNSAPVHLWLVYLNADNALQFKRIEFGANHSVESPRTEVSFVCDLPVVDVHWLSSNQLLVCTSKGSILLLLIKAAVGEYGHTEYYVEKENILDLSADLHDQDATFTSFALIESKSRSPPSKMASRTKLSKSYSMAAMTKYKLTYLELLEDSAGGNFSFERVDELDLSSSLQKMELSLERAEWSADSSRLAVQLSNNHILVYRTKLDDYMVASYRSKVAYLSAANEITVLDYGDASGEPDENSDGNKALTLTLDMKPSVISIGGRHLAVALNNRVRFFQIASVGRVELDERAQLLEEREYVSIVGSLGLSSHYAAIYFNDRRLKLHAIRKKASQCGSQADGEMSEVADEEDSLNERFFPDPNNKNETIAAFTLTEQLFVYCTSQLTLVVFDLARWTTMQICDHSRSPLARPIARLRPNQAQNKMVCLAQPGELSSNVLLYDLYSNSMVRFAPDTLHLQMLSSQLLCQPSLVTHGPTRLELANWRPEQSPWPSLSRIEDAIWDSDGRMVILFERNLVHSFVAIDHTLASEETVLLHVDSAAKPASYTALYASQGIVSYQTALGRVVNLVLEAHDDELRLTQLEERLNLAIASDEASSQLEGLKLKLAFLRSILPIYSLGRLRDLCEHLMTDESLNPKPDKRANDLELVFWRQLAAWALFTCNLRLARSIYQAHRMPVEARVLREILSECRSKNLDLKATVKSKVLEMLGCDTSIG